MFSAGEFPVAKGIRPLMLGKPARWPTASWVARPRGGWSTVAGWHAAAAGSGWQGLRLGVPPPRPAFDAISFYRLGRP